MRDEDRPVAREVILRALFGPGPLAADSLMARMTETVETLEVQPGDVLARVDEPSEEVFMIADGCVRLSRPGRADIVYRGHWMVGITDVVLRRPRRRAIVVEAGSHVLRMSAAAFAEIMVERADLPAFAVLDIAREIDALNGRVGVLPSGPTSTEPLPPVSTLVGRMALLEGVPFLAGATVQAIADLAADATVEEVPVGAVLLHPERPDPRVMVVAEGSIELTREGAPRGDFGVGQVVGGMAWHVGRDGGFRATARAPSVVLAFTVDAWLDRMEVHPSLAMAGLAALSAERERLQEELADHLGELVLD